MKLKQKLSQFLTTQVELKLRDLIRIARELGLPDWEVKNAEAMLAHNEWFEGFDIVVTQMHEYEISTNEEFIVLAKDILSTSEVPDSVLRHLRSILEELSKQNSAK